MSPVIIMTSLWKSKKSRLFYRGQICTRRSYQYPPLHSCGVIYSMVFSIGFLLYSPEHTRADGWWRMVDGDMVDTSSFTRRLMGRRFFASLKRWAKSFQWGPELLSQEKMGFSSETMGRYSFLHRPLAGYKTGFSSSWNGIEGGRGRVECFYPVEKKWGRFSSAGTGGYFLRILLTVPEMTGRNGFCGKKCWGGMFLCLKRYVHKTGPFGPSVKKTGVH